MTLELGQHVHWAMVNLLPHPATLTRISNLRRGRIEEAREEMLTARHESRVTWLNQPQEGRTPQARLRHYREQGRLFIKCARVYMENGVSWQNMKR
jgi:hypothetical protein